MTFGGSGPFQVMGNVQERDADKPRGRALETGINFIDAADTCSGGDSKRIFGQALKNLGHARDGARR